MGIDVLVDMEIYIFHVNKESVELNHIYSMECSTNAQV